MESWSESYEELASGDSGMEQPRAEREYDGEAKELSLNKELIEEFKVQTTTVGEGASKIKEKVAESLLSAINDSQVVAGI
jgi:hypothetical protein